MGEIADLLKLFSRSTSNSVPAPFDRGDACRLCEDIPQRAFVPVAALFRDERDRYVRVGKQPLRLAHSDGEYLVVCSEHAAGTRQIGKEPREAAEERLRVRLPVRLGRIEDLSAAPSAITPSGRQKCSTAFNVTPSSSALTGSTCQPRSRAAA